ncbi:response regulator [Algicella marina]|uniref:Response regulator n=1 Tax=Algicella marina TaxID=2683284 RepID=A0A6P1SV18_9RHOB|nr:response regulator [Algicella marina]QHQ34298.1 response regulator [Algicella marina]
MVDDDSTEIRLLQRGFAKAEAEVDFETHLGSNGAAERMRRGDIDLVLLDINMPGMSGFEVLRQTREARRSSFPAVIMLSTSDNADDVARAYSEGANAYLLKPHGSDGLRKLVDAINAFWTGLVIAAPT